MKKYILILGIIILGIGIYPNLSTATELFETETIGGSSSLGTGDYIAHKIWNIPANTTFSNIELNITNKDFCSDELSYFIYDTASSTNPIGGDLLASGYYLCSAFSTGTTTFPLTHHTSPTASSSIWFVIHTNSSPSITLKQNTAPITQLYSGTSTDGITWSLATQDALFWFKLNDEFSSTISITNPTNESTSYDFDFFKFAFDISNIDFINYTYKVGISFSQNLTELHDYSSTNNYYQTTNNIINGLSTSTAMIAKVKKLPANTVWYAQAYLKACDPESELEFYLNPCTINLATSSIISFGRNNSNDYASSTEQDLNDALNTLEGTGKLKDLLNIASTSTSELTWSCNVNLFGVDDIDICKSIFEFFYPSEYVKEKIALAFDDTFIIMRQNFPFSIFSVIKNGFSEGLNSSTSTTNWDLKIPIWLGSTTTTPDYNFTIIASTTIQNGLGSYWDIINSIVVSSIWVSGAMIIFSLVFKT